MRPTARTLVATLVLTVLWGNAPGTDHIVWGDILEALWQGLNIVWST